MNTNEIRDTTEITYEVRVYVATTWPTGTPRGTMMRTFHITEEATILGGARAIDAAVDQCKGLAMNDVHSPEITPNPAELGWPLGAK
jgi:hypothetical protein